MNGDDISFCQTPDLLVIDGGKGQLSSVCEVLDEYNKNYDIISLAEKFEEVFKPNQSTPIMLKRGSSELRILQAIRDEAHRFAITFHRKLRSKAMIKSPLDDIKGLGKVKKQALFDTFGSFEQIKKASVNELNLVKGIDITLAIRIKNIIGESDEKN